MPLKLLKLLSCFKKIGRLLLFSEKNCATLTTPSALHSPERMSLLSESSTEPKVESGRRTSPSGDEMKLVFVHKKDPRLSLKYFAFPTFFSTSLHFLTFFPSRAAMARLPRGYPPGEPAKSLTSESTGYSRRSGRETLPKSSSPNTFPPGRR